MNDIRQIITQIGGGTNLMIFIILLAVGTKFIIDLIDYFKNKLEKWRKDKNGEEDTIDTLEDKIKKLEQSDGRQMEKLNDIDARIQNIASSLELMAENNRNNIVTTARSNLYRLHKEFTVQGYVTLAEREMFDSVSSIYLNNGGNSIFKNKIIPEVEALPIKN